MLNLRFVCNPIGDGMTACQLGCFTYLHWLESLMLSLSDMDEGPVLPEVCTTSETLSTKLADIRSGGAITPEEKLKESLCSSCA